MSSSTEGQSEKGGSTEEVPEEESSKGNLPKGGPPKVSPVTGRPVAVYDANVLYPAQLRDFLMRLAIGGVVRAHWTEQIHDEWSLNVHADYSDITWEELKRIRRLMDEALPGATVEDYEELAGDLSLPDPDDRHVLAAAIRIEADYIVTFNKRDFPPDRLGPHEIQAIKPDQFVALQYGRVPQKVIEVASKHRASLTQPPKGVEEYLDILREGGLNYSARLLEEHGDEL